MSQSVQKSGSRNSNPPPADRNPGRNYYDVPGNGQERVREKPKSEDDYVPVGMTLFIFQTGFKDLPLTMAWRAGWFVFYLILFGVQFEAFEPAILPFRLPFWSILLALAYFLLGILQVARQALDKSLLTRLVQLFYVVSYSFTVGSSVFYIFLLFMDDVNRNNPRKDNLYIVMADGYISYPYLKTTDNVDDANCEVEFTHPRNLEGTVVNSHRYNFFWFYHVACHVLLPAILFVPLYLENTRIYYIDFVAAFVFSLAYTGWLWAGSVSIYNRENRTPCIGSTSPYCDDNKVNPEYRTIYTKLNFYQKGETAAYLLLLYFVLFIIFYLGRQISKRYARSALLTYKKMNKENPAEIILQSMPAIPDEASQRGGAQTKAGLYTTQIVP